MPCLGQDFLAFLYLFKRIFARRTKIAAVLARVFAPLFLIMSTAFLTVALELGRNPFVDRDFLILMNGLLLVVLLISLLSIANQGTNQQRSFGEWITLGLLAITMLIDLQALASIVFRLASFGFSPNRVVVLGANLVILGHLAVILRGQLVHLRTGTRQSLHQAAAGYLPVYVIWAAFVFFVLPLLFRFQ